MKLLEVVAASKESPAEDFKTAVDFTVGLIQD